MRGQLQRFPLQLLNEHLNHRGLSALDDGVGAQLSTDSCAFVPRKHNLLMPASRVLWHFYELPDPAAGVAGGELHARRAALAIRLGVRG